MELACYFDVILRLQNMKKKDTSSPIGDGSGNEQKNIDAKKLGDKIGPAKKNIHTRELQKDLEDEHISHQPDEEDYNNHSHRGGWSAHALCFLCHQLIFQPVIEITSIY